MPYTALHNPDLFQGDIIGIEDNDVRNAIPSDNLRWPGGKVYYVLDASISHLQGKILEAMRKISSSTCITFEQRSSQNNYIRFFKGEGCYSHVGCTGGSQPLSLGKGCEFVGTIIHEILHALGFYHEQNRSDRDEYLEIYWNNIQKGMESQFTKLAPNQNRLLTSFDHYSIMIYGEYSFSIKPGQLQTMKAKSGTVIKDPYEKQDMTNSDKQRVNTLYKC